MRALRAMSAGALAVYWVLLFVLTHLPAPRVAGVRVNDKLMHAVAYFALGVLLYQALWLWRPRWGRVGVVVIAAGAGYGAVDEWTQPLVGRSCELGDWLADVAGILAAVAVMAGVRVGVAWSGARATPRGGAQRNPRIDPPRHH